MDRGGVGMPRGWRCHRPSQGLPTTRQASHHDIVMPEQLQLGQVHRHCGCADREGQGTTEGRTRGRGQGGHLGGVPGPESLERMLVQRGKAAIRREARQGEERPDPVSRTRRPGVAESGGASKGGKKGLQQDDGCGPGAESREQASPFPSVSDASWRCRMDLERGRGQGSQP